MITLAAVDDHAMLLRGVAAYLDRQAPDIRLVAVSEDVAALVASGVRATVVLLDINLRAPQDLAASVSTLRGTGAQVLLYTSEHRPAVVREGLRAGALGLVLKEDPEDSLVDGIRSAATGEPYVSGDLALQIVNDPSGEVRLSTRERQVMTMRAQGLSDGQTASRLGISIDTVRTYRKRAIERYLAVVSDAVNPGVVPFRMLREGHLDLK